MRLGVIGCGTISEVYLKNLTASTEVEVVACADVFPERAAAPSRGVRCRQVVQPRGAAGGR